MPLDDPAPSSREVGKNVKSEETVDRGSSSEEVVLYRPRNEGTKPDPGLGMAFESTIPEESGAVEVSPPEKRGRESIDDAKRDEYWRGYYDRKRRERERERDREDEYLPPTTPTRPQQRYIEYGEPSKIYRSNSARKTPVQYRAPRPMSYAAEPGPRRFVQIDDDDMYAGDEIYVAKPGKRGSGYASPPRRPSSELSKDLRIPFTNWMNTTLKGHFVAALGEFVGTTMFLFFAFAGTQVANVGGTNVQNSTTGASTGFSPEVLLYISLIFGFSLMVNVWIFFRISGGLFNPAVTLAMAMTRAITVFRALLLVIMQIVGSIFASFIVKVLFPTEFKVRTTLSSGTSVTRGVFIEAICTFELVFTIFLLAKEKHKATFIAPVGIGLALFIAEMVGVYYTGGSLNPARSFGPCVVSGVFDKEHWIYWVGPGLGAITAVVFYKFIKILEYELANPGQEAASDKEALQIENESIKHMTKPVGPDAV